MEHYTKIIGSLITNINKLHAWRFVMLVLGLLIALFLLQFPDILTSLLNNGAMQYEPFKAVPESSEYLSGDEGAT